jgi:hypothetical protein
MTARPKIFTEPMKNQQKLISSNSLYTTTTMPTAAGLFFSTFLGLLTRRLQVTMIGKQFPRSWDRATGYVLSSGVFIGGYLVFDNYIENNRKLMDRRLTVLREQRAQKEAFHEFFEEPDHRLTADKKGRFFSLLDKYGASYK